MQHSKHLLEMKKALQKNKSWSRRENPAGITDVEYFPYWSVNLELIKAALPRRHWRVNRSGYQSRPPYSQGLEYKTTTTGAETAPATGEGSNLTKLLWSETSWWRAATQDRKQNHTAPEKYLPKTWANFCGKDSRIRKFPASSRCHMGFGWPWTLRVNSCIVALSIQWAVNHGTEEQWNESSKDLRTVKWGPSKKKHSR